MTALTEELADKIQALVDTSLDSVEELNPREVSAALTLNLAPAIVLSAKVHGTTIANEIERLLVLLDKLLDKCVDPNEWEPVAPQPNVMDASPLGYRQCDE